MNTSFLHLMSIWLKHFKDDTNNFRNTIDSYYNLFKEIDNISILQTMISFMTEDEQTEFKRFLENKYSIIIE